LVTRKLAALATHATVDEVEIIPYTVEEVELQYRCPQRLELPQKTGWVKSKAAERPLPVP